MYPSHRCSRLRLRRMRKEYICSLSTLLMPAMRCITKGLERSMLSGTYTSTTPERLVTRFLAAALGT